MTLDIQLKKLASLESGYLPNDKISRQLKEKTLVMVVGPAAIGKSSVMNAAVKLHPDFERVSGFTSREQRPNDEPELYKYISPDEAGLNPVIGEIEHGELVQYAIHPTTHALYATRIEDHKGKYNLLDTLASTVETLRRLPFKNTVLIGLVTDPDTWKEWFFERYPQKSPERFKRLQEALISLTWLLGQPDGKVLWCENKVGYLDETAKELVTLCLGKVKVDIELKILASECLKTARLLLEEEAHE